MRKIFVFLVGIALSGCSALNPSIMFKTPKNYKFDSIPMIPEGEYKISPNDILEFKIFSNDGFRLIDITSSLQGNMQIGAVSYLVEKDGQVKLPVIGRILIRDLSVLQAQKLLEEKYSYYYNKPFILIKVLNKRVYLFPGAGGSGTVISLENENTTLIEALAKAGGISGTGKAHKVKLIRNSASVKPEVLLIDLSTINGLKDANIVLQSNDIIYVDPIRRVSQGVLSEISPIIGIVTSFLFVYSLFIKK